MASVALIPALALVCGALAGIVRPDIADLRVVVVLLWAGAVAAWIARRPRAWLAVTVAAYLLCGAQLGAAAARRALSPPLRDTLDAAFGGFLLTSIGPGGAHPPLRTRVRLLEDAAPRDDGVSLRASVEAVRIGDVMRPAAGGVLLGVNGDASASRLRQWRAGRRLELPVTFRRPARYLNDGVADVERDMALDGIALAGTVKSGLLVDMVSRGSLVEETAARARAHVRRTIAARVGLHDPVRAAIVTAILIGDRTGLPPEIRDRLQAAGTYHVIAISGGNIAILAALMFGVCTGLGLAGRPRALLMIVGLSAYAALVTPGPSVWRATLTGLAYLAARLFDHRSPPWNAMAISAAILACVSPLDVRDAGFALTFGATIALLETARRLRGRLTMPGPPGWIFATVITSLAVEIVLLPIAARDFSRVTAAGLLLNLAALPLMTVAQVAGLVLVIGSRIELLARAAAWLADVSTGMLVGSAGLVDAAPWLSPHVPPPSLAIVGLYYAALGGAAIRSRWRRLVAIASLVGLAAAIVGGYPRDVSGFASGTLRMTVFDVGQGDAVLIQLPDGVSMMVDTGGIGFGSGSFDIGTRVLAPALWARGLRRLDLLTLTHGDPDHIGGAPALMRDFAPRQLWEGVRVPGHRASEEIRGAARAAGMRLVEPRAGRELSIGPVRVRTLNPPPPEWQRVRVRNDDSLVMEILYGDVAVLLTGDVDAEVERQIASRLTPAPIRILKVAHHGSRTSTSRELLESWRPTVAVISCGRGNTFGHPHLEVLARLTEVGALVLRTDLYGQITIETDGRSATYRTFVGPRGVVTKGSTP